MSFQTPITVKEAVENIRAKKYLLPSIQRELVWNTHQIEKLFDSLMRDYPVGSFLFWHVDKSRISDFTFYEFIRNYHERDSKHNKKAEFLDEGDITAILDGQQRLTSLYIGLLGSYAEKTKGKKWKNDAAFPKRFLYLNLLKKITDDEELELEYDFYFLTPEEAQEFRDDEPESYFYFKVGDVFGFTKPHEINSFLIRNGLMTDEKTAEFASETLFKLYSIINEEKIINFFLEKHGELDKVLNIFVRINSGGTPLSYSDLLLSIASASWQKKDAREEITGFVDEISEDGEGFNFNKDFVLKTCLVLCDFPNVAFKVDNFNRANMQVIEDNWNEITASLKLTVNLIESFGYKRETLISNNALIPIAYYLRKKGNPKNFVDSRQFQEDRAKIQKWLISSLLKRAFSGQPDNVIRIIRQIIAKNHDSFPLERIVEEFRGKDKSIIFSLDDIEALFDSQYGNAYTFSTLAVLYPTLDFKNKFHVDHIFPKSVFKRKNLIGRGIPEEKADSFTELVDYLANLQLLEGIPNIEKSSKDFKQWLFEKYPNPQARKEYMEKNYIPNVDLSLENFDVFFEERTKLMTKGFYDLLKL
jgi:uncharacterized protein with ParB-like and HNH nuclease domain